MRFQACTRTWIDRLDLKIATRPKPPKLLSRKDWWLPQWTLPLSAAARHKERTGIDYVPIGQEPPQMLVGSDPEDSSEDEGCELE